MAYFFVLPIIVLMAIAMTIATLICRVVPALRFLYPVAWRVTLWANGGAIVANIPVFLLYFVPLGLQATGAKLNPQDWRARGVAFVVLIGLTVGPFVATAAGYLLGGLLGVWRAIRSSRRARIYA